MGKRSTSTRIWHLEALCGRSKQAMYIYIMHKATCAQRQVLIKTIKVFTLARKAANFCKFNWILMLLTHLLYQPIHFEIRFSSVNAIR